MPAPNYAQPPHRPSQYSPQVNQSSSHGGMSGGQVAAAAGAAALIGALGGALFERSQEESHYRPGHHSGYSGGNVHHKRCYKCEGKGFCHDSNMDHDRSWNEKCFFCKTCDGCGGSGTLKEEDSNGGWGGWNTGGVHHKRCFKCEGKGFCHDSSMDHDKPWHERCFFCKDCNACGGSGHLTEESSGWGGRWEEERIGFCRPQGRDFKERCYRCEGKGFSHDSSMDHDKPWDEKCFFCKECHTCRGRGYVS
eukprot:gnl/MRDRNA2_/MRDRNA2_115660_c0_seq1.p1 gnl/MRDRNA2_/MRDRNA2_115660_c0~~gnl/MRDRNA2_/MRDRNA2_115660_c0_seq1.p1  ORF type:complete len:276 (-),score=54.20 gnl/MRDRNA2_/MRDRNA2_115660_c0_seq1:232-981(-)